MPIILFPHPNESYDLLGIGPVHPFRALMKWILALIAALLAGFFLFRSDGGPKVAYVNGLPEYNHLPGQEYILQRDCYIFKFTDRDSSWPLIASHPTIPALPETVSAEQIGKTVGNARIIGLARVGERFKIASVRRTGEGPGAVVSFEILFLDEARREDPRMDAYWMMSHDTTDPDSAPKIREEYAVLRIKA